MVNPHADTMNTPSSVPSVTYNFHFARHLGLALRPPSTSRSITVIATSLDRLRIGVARMRRNGRGFLVSFLQHHLIEPQQFTDGPRLERTTPRHVRRIAVRDF